MSCARRRFAACADEISATSYDAEGVELVRSCTAGLHHSKQPSKRFCRLCERHRRRPAVSPKQWIAGACGRVRGESPDHGQTGRYREAHTDAIATEASRSTGPLGPASRSEGPLGPGSVHKLDVTLPPGELASFMSEIRTLVIENRPNAKVWLFGHAGDGNIHVNITGVAQDDEAIDEIGLRAGPEREGSIVRPGIAGPSEGGYTSIERRGDRSCSAPANAAVDPEGILTPGAASRLTRLSRETRGAAAQNVAKNARSSL